MGIQTLTLGPDLPFDVRCSVGASVRATTSAGLAAAAYRYFEELLGPVKPDIALIVADEDDWPGKGTPYGLPFFRDTDDHRAGALVMSAGPGDFWADMVAPLRATSPEVDAALVAAYPDGRGGVDLQPFFDLVTIHELAHAFETLDGLDLPRLWLSEIFVNLALHAFIATHCPEQLPTLETLPTLGASSVTLADQMRTEGYSSLSDADEHYPSGAAPMSPGNYVWFQYRWQRLAAMIWAADGQDGLIRFWRAFHPPESAAADASDAKGLASFLASNVSRVLGHAIATWH